MSVSQLKELHDKTRIGDPPVYTFEQFTRNFTATCSYRGEKTIGYGLSKKDSQRAAADKMLMILNNAPALPLKPIISQTKTNASCQVSKILTNEQKVKALRFLAEYEDEDPNSDARNSMAPDQQIIDEPDMRLKKDHPHKSSTLTAGSQYEDAIDTFKQIMKEMKLKFFCKVPDIKHDATSDHIVVIPLYYNVHLMAGGTGSSIESAT